jgi:peptidoglycan/xylan/chitin deacetylase (PgdA/CDA1 family)
MIGTGAAKRMPRRLKRAAKGVLAELCSHAPLNRVICWRFPRRHRKVALTFDDGPNPDHTRGVLDILEQHSIRATFFVLGISIERNPDVFQDVVDAGHEIGIHGYTHTNDNLGAQTERTLEILSRFGVTSTIFRPPHGILEASTGLWMLRHRISVVLWSVDARDSMRHDGKVASDGHDSFDLIEAGDIVLMHDDNPVCESDLHEIIEVLNRNQLGAASVSELLHAA